MVKGKVLVEFTDTDDHAAWSLEVVDWSSTRGYPSCVSFFENRLCFASTTSRPQTVWRSVVDDYENFATDADDDSASDEFTLVSGLMDKIQWISGHDSLIIGTAGGIWRLGASTSTEALA